MLTKLKCFFGLHEWEHSDQDGPHHGQVLRKRKCKCCPKKQKEGLRGKYGCYPYWINYKSVQVNFRSKGVRGMIGKATNEAQEKYRPLNAGEILEDPQINVDTPMPECKEPVSFKIPKGVIIKQPELKTVCVFNDDGKCIGSIDTIEDGIVHCVINDKNMIQAIRKPFNMSIGFKMEMDNDE